MGDTNYSVESEEECFEMDDDGKLSMIKKSDEIYVETNKLNL